MNLKQIKDSFSTKNNVLEQDDFKRIKETADKEQQVEYLRKTGKSGMVVLETDDAMSVVDSYFERVVNKYKSGLVVVVRRGDTSVSKKEMSRYKGAYTVANQYDVYFNGSSTHINVANVVNKNGYSYGYIISHYPMQTWSEAQKSIEMKLMFIDVRP